VRETVRWHTGFQNKYLDDILQLYGRHREEDIGKEEMMNLGFSVVTGSQDADFVLIHKSRHHNLTGGRDHHEFLNSLYYRTELAHSR
jgi:hypothetical protein